MVVVHSTLWLKGDFIPSFSGSIGKVDIFPVKRIKKFIHSSQFKPNGSPVGSSGNPRRTTFIYFASVVYIKSFLPLRDTSSSQNFFSVFYALIHATDCKHSLICKVLQ